MIDATVAPKVGCISPFGTTACNVNHINAQHQGRATASAAPLLCVPCMLLLGVILHCMCNLRSRLGADGDATTPHPHERARNSSSDNTSSAVAFFLRSSRC